MTISDIDQGEDMGALIAETADAVLATVGAIGSGEARRAADEASWYAGGWKALLDAGFIQAMRQENEGGVGIAAAMTIVRLAGGAAVSLPFAEAMGADWLLAKAGRPSADRPTVFAAVPVKLTREHDGVRVSGMLTAVPWARMCDLVCIGSFEERAVLLTLSRDSFVVTDGRNLADEPRDRVNLDQLVSHRELAALPSDFHDETTLRLGAALRSAQLAGAAEAAVQMTADYSRERAQFGRPISRFQAVQQLLAVMVGEAAAARVAADLAVRALEGALGFEAIASAKIRTGEAAGKIAAAAHEIHGAIGFTREHSLQLLTRRLWSWRDEFGSEAEWSTALGRSLSSRPSPLWAAITEF